MLGPVKPRRLNAPVTVSLEDLVPRTHFYRHLEVRLDLSFVRDWVGDCYAARGRPSIDPVVFFKLQLVRFFQGIRSERKLIETASLPLAQIRERYKFVDDAMHGRRMDAAKSMPIVEPVAVGPGQLALPL
jgi:hypothetical protein